MKKVDITLMSSACYSGGWVIYPNNHFSTLTAAAGHDKELLSWTASASLERVSGSVWLSDIAKVLTSVKSPMLEQDLSPEQGKISDETRVNETYAAFIRTDPFNLVHRNGPFRLSAV